MSVIIFAFFQNHGANLCQIWHKAFLGLIECTCKYDSNEGMCLFPREDKSGMIKKNIGVFFFRKKYFVYFAIVLKH